MSPNRGNLSVVPDPRLRSRRGPWRRGGRLHRTLLHTAAPFGLLNPIQSLFGLRRVDPDDIFVASYPRSGNTWTRYILAYLVRGTAESLNLHTVNTIVPDAYITPQLINARSGQRLIKSHELWLEHYPRVIYIHRDCREALVSYWYFVRRTERYRGSFSEFLRSCIPSRFGSWKQHMLAMRRRMAADASTIHVIRYDDLVARFLETLSALVAWSAIGQEVDLDAVRRLTTPDALVASESVHDATFRPPFGVSFYADRGQGAAWQTIWSAADLALLERDRQLITIMDELGYR